MKKAILVFILIFSIFSFKKSETEEIAKPKNEQVKLHVYDGGKIVVNKLELFSQDTTYQYNTNKREHEGF